ncbi:MAG: hypothetical protein IT328_11050 [Caldilineaceae bacterium]|nr:hypothetical protein [Caldilineaceae bacterium]
MNGQESERPKRGRQPSSAQQPPEQPTGEQGSNERIKAEQADYEPEYHRPGPRRPGEARANAFNSIAWMVEGATGLVEELRHSDLGLSEDFWIHVYAMRREGLLAARAAIDSLLSKSDQESREAAEQVKREERRGDIAIE